MNIKHKKSDLVISDTVSDILKKSETIKQYTVEPSVVQSSNFKSDITRVTTLSILGLEPTRITVEVDTLPGIPQLHIIGLPSKVVEEAKERIVSVFKAIGIEPRRKKTIVNLTPSDIPKTSAGIELAIAIALLSRQKHITLKSFSKDCAFVGSLSLDGSLLPVRGLLPLAIAAQEVHMSNFYYPACQKNLISQISKSTSDQAELQHHLENKIPGRMKFHPINHISELILNNKKQMQSIQQDRQVVPKFALQHSAHSKNLQEESENLGKRTQSSNARSVPNFSEIIGQAPAKRALTIAAAGGHNVLMTGPPGIGKTLLAQAMVGILPPLTDQEKLISSALHSLVHTHQELIDNRPFYQPHHTISYVGMVGGTAQLLPGEVSLAHRGVLFLDEIAEFPRHILEALRQPLSDGHITIKRAQGAVTYPAQFTLIAATNPCPCGYYQSRISIGIPTQKQCNCSELERSRYTKKISGPILDRIDMHLFLENTSLHDLDHSSKHTSNSSLDNGNQSSEIQKKVSLARSIQYQRYSDQNIQKSSKPLQYQHDTVSPSIAYQINAQMSHSYIYAMLQKNDELRTLLTQIQKKMGLSNRAIFSCIKVAQTISDLENTNLVTQGNIQKASRMPIKTDHLLEAIQYRKSTYN